MAQIPYRANLSAAIFPMTLARAGRSVIIPGADNNFDRRVDPAGEQTDAGIPQVIYGENILPTEQGYQSVGYRPLGGSFPSQPTECTMLAVPENQAMQAVTLLFTATKIYSCYKPGWKEVVVSGAFPVVSESMCSYAIVRGVVYIQTFTRLHTLTYDAFTDTHTLTDITATVTPAGFMNDVASICSSYNYLIAVKPAAGTVHWSSTLTATDFVPSTITGAGSGSPTGAPLGAVVRANSEGFFIFGSPVIGVRYTGNVRYPWRFDPIEGTSFRWTRGLGGDYQSSAYIVSTNNSDIYALTPSGYEHIGEQLAELINRISYTDSFNYTTNVFGLTFTGTPSAEYRLTFLLDRYIILSRSDGTVADKYSHAYVYDTKFKRYGVLKIYHTHISEIVNLFSFGIRQIIFVDTYAGTTTAMTMDVQNQYTYMQGVIVIGKMQYVRSRFLCLDEVSAESTHLSPADGSSRNFQAYALPTLDGKTFLPAVPLFLDTTRSGSQVMNYFSSAEGKNISLMFKGAFDLSSVEMKFHLGGKY